MKYAFKLCAVLLASIAALVLLASPAFAEEMTEVAPTTVALEPWLLAILAGTVSPVLTGLVTKLGATSALKAITGFFIVAVLTVLNIIISSNGVFVVRDVVIIMATTFVMHVSTYYGLWKPTGVENLAPTRGLGNSN